MSRNGLGENTPAGATAAALKDTRIATPRHNGEFHFILRTVQILADTSGAACIYAVGPHFISAKDQNRREAGGTQSNNGNETSATAAPLKRHKDAPPVPLGSKAERAVMAS